MPRCARAKLVRSNHEAAERPIVRPPRQLARTWLEVLTLLNHVARDSHAQRVVMTVSGPLLA